MAPSRALHSSSNRSSATENLIFDDAALSQPNNSQPPLSVLPLTTVLRTLMTTTISSSPLLLPPSLALMSLLANTTSPLLNPDKNPLLKYLLKHTFYAQFCAGENASEVRHTITSLKKLGFQGVILGYAREVVLSESESASLSDTSSSADEITPWMNGTLETVALASESDFVALKFTGAGSQALWRLSRRLDAGEELGAAIDRICGLAKDRGVRLLFDAEQTAVQGGIDDWTLQYMRRWNTEGAVVYGTYQAYLRRTPEVLKGHLEMASNEGWVMGVKLVRGAYLGSDPRDVIWGTKRETDAAYDGIAAAVMRRRWGGILQGKGEFPRVEMVLATHNAESVRKGREILERGEGRAEVAFAQLQGMADEVSCELVAGKGERHKAYKYLVWGSTGECMKYLLRRAHENRDAVQRTKSGRAAMRGEVARRVKALFGLA
ncbi:hypothetical protein OQA88_7701 [Cercophora sp. LCS_1]